MNIQEFARTFVENYDKVSYLSFLESLRTQENGVLVEAIQSGFGVLCEDAKSLNDIVGYIRQVEGTYKKFRGEDEGLESTRQMMSVIDDRKGRVRVKSLKGFPDFVSDFEFSPEGESTEADIRNAKKVLITSVMPFALQKSTQGLAGNNFTDHKKGVAYDTIVNSLTNLQENLPNFHFNGVPFIGWARNWISNAKKEIRSQDTRQEISKTWKTKTPVAKGDVFHSQGQTWKANFDLTAEENTQPPNADMEKRVSENGEESVSPVWSKTQASEGDFASMDAPVNQSNGKSHSNEEEDILLKDVAQAPTEDDMDPERDTKGEHEEAMKKELANLQAYVLEHFKDPISKGLVREWFRTRLDEKKVFDYNSLYKEWEAEGLKVNETDAKEHIGTITLPDGKVVRFNRQNINNWKDKVDAVVTKEANLIAKNRVSATNFKKVGAGESEKKTPTTSAPVAKDPSPAVGNPESNVPTATAVAERPVAPVTPPPVTPKPTLQMVDEDDEEEQSRPATQR